MTVLPWRIQAFCLTPDYLLASPREIHESGGWYSPLSWLPVCLVHSLVTSPWQTSCSIVKGQHSELWKASSSAPNLCPYLKPFSSHSGPRAGFILEPEKKRQVWTPARHRGILLPVATTAFLSSAKEHWNVNVCIWKTGFGFNSSLAEKSIEFLQIQREKLKSSRGKLETANARCVYNTISGSLHESREFSHSCFHLKVLSLFI